jgi:hypothetical protein
MSIKIQIELHIRAILIVYGDSEVATVTMSLYLALVGFHTKIAISEHAAESRILRPMSTAPSQVGL